ncbi:MAG: arsenite efflux transporter metallochaperone ArsD [Opitutales bacterium]
MKKITIYDPPMCCSSGVCGPEVDPVLPRVAGMLSQIQGQGVKVERYNLAQQPIAFAQNTEVRALLEKEGTEALPLFYIDGELAIKGRYPEQEERAAWVKQAREAASRAAT